MVVLIAEDGSPVQAVVVEVQLGKDRHKRWTWPVYLSTLRARLRCPAALLVVCVDTRTAAWCAGPIVLGHPGWVLRPLTVGPEQVPVLTDRATALQAPELAVLSAMTHGSHPQHERVLDVMVEALDVIDKDRAVQYAEFVLAALPAAARRYLEGLMAIQTYEFQSDYARRLRAEGAVDGETRGRATGHAEGRAVGWAEGRAVGVVEGRAIGRDEGREEGLTEGEVCILLRVLDARGITIPDPVLSRITECTDLDLLASWASRAATAHTIDELFD